MLSYKKRQHNQCKGGVWRGRVKVPFANIAKRDKAYKEKKRGTYKMIKG